MYEVHEASTVSFAVAWAEVSPHLAGYLRKRGNLSADVDDLLQIVAERALANEIPFESADDLLHWCLTVARNLDIDRHRAAARHPMAALDAILEPAETSGLEERVMWRLRLAATLHALSFLKPRDRWLILSGMDPDRVATGAERVARHRARTRLLELVGPPAIVMFFAGAGRRIQRSLSTAIAVPVIAAAAAAFAVLGPVSPTSPNFLDPTERPVPAVLKTSTFTNATLTRSVPVTASAAVSGPRTVGDSSRVGNSHEVPVATTPGGVVQVYGEDRRPQDTGLVCVKDVPLLVGGCFGPGAAAVRP